MKKTKITITKENIPIISAKANLLITKLFKINFFVCLLAGYFFVNDLVTNTVKESSNKYNVQTDSYLIVSAILFVLLVILMRYLHLYFSYKKMHNKKYNDENNYTISYKNEYLIGENINTKIKVNYDKIFFIGKVDLLYFMAYLDDNEYFILPIGNVGIDGFTINELLVNCHNLKFKKIVSYNSKKKLCILLFVILFLMFLVNFTRFLYCII